MNGFSVVAIDVYLTECDLFKFIDNKTFLILTEIENNPPHCSMLCDDHWLSLNFNECKVQVPKSTLFKTLIRRSKSAIFLKLNINLNLSETQNIFSSYTKINFHRQITCISPIKEVLIKNGVSVAYHALLYEMIDFLVQNNYVQQVYAFNYNWNEYKIQHYSMNNLIEIQR